MSFHFFLFTIIIIIIIIVKLEVVGRSGRLVFLEEKNLEKKKKEKQKYANDKLSCIIT